MRVPGSNMNHVLRREMDRGAQALIRPFGAPYPPGEGNGMESSPLERPSSFRNEPVPDGEDGQADEQGEGPVAQDPRLRRAEDEEPTGQRDERGHGEEPHPEPHPL